MNKILLMLSCVSLLALAACDPFRTRVISLNTPNESLARHQEGGGNVHEKAFKIVEEIAFRNHLRPEPCADRETVSICKGYDGSVYLEAYVNKDGEFRIRILNTSAISSLNRIEEELATALRQTFGADGLKIQ